MALALLLYAAAAPVAESAWATGYPRIAFGHKQLGADQTTAPTSWRSQPPVGGEPQGLTLALKVDDSTPFAGATGSSISLHLPGFLGADQTWASDATKAKMYTIDGTGNFALITKFKTGSDKAVWSSSTQMITLNFNQLGDADVKDKSLIVVLEASSFAEGKGPLAPKCSAADTTAFVSTFTPTTTALLTPVGGIAPVGCFDQEVVPKGVQQHYFAIKKIGQKSSSNAIGSDTVITVTISPSMDLATSSGLVSTIIIDGLLGSETGDSSNLAISPKSEAHITSNDLFSTTSGDAVVSNTAEWNQATGTLTLSIATDRQIAAFTPIAFSFTLKLANTASSSTLDNVAITAKFGTSFLISKSKMDLGVGSAAPLFAAPAAIITANIGQKVTGPGQQNTLTVTIRTNVAHASTASSTAKVTISGLIGSTTTDSSAQNPFQITPLSGTSVDGLFSQDGTDNRGKWTKASGTLVLSVKNGETLSAGDDYVFSFRLINSGSAMDSPTVKIQSSLCPAREMSTANGDAAPLKVKAAAFELKKIGQSSPYIGAANELRVTMMTNVGIQAVGTDSSAGVTITGLAGFTNADGDFAIANRGYNSVDDIFSTATWTKSEGKLVFKIAPGKQLQAGTIYSFGVTLTNPSTGQASPAISISQTGSTADTIAPVSVDKGSGSSAPLLVKKPGFETARVGQSSSSAGGSNTITVTLQPDLDIVQGALVTIEGLVGSGTGDATDLAVAGCDGNFESLKTTPEANKGKWDKASGRLEVAAAKKIAAGTTLTCSFTISNPSAVREAVNVDVEVNSVSTGQISNLIPTTRLRNAPGKSAPLTIMPPTFVTAKIGQNKPFASVTDNSITVTLKSNSALSSAGSSSASITISGLLNSQTADTSSLTISAGAFATAVGGTGSWNKKSGTLSMTVATGSTLAANTDYIFSFTLSNPAAGQKAATVLISATGGARITAVAMEQDTDGCVHSIGDMTPFFVYEPGFLTKTASFSRTAVGSSTAVSLVLKSAVQLEASATFTSSIIVAFPLYFTTAATSALAISSSHPSILGSTADWVPSTGKLTLTVQSGQVVAPNTEYRVTVTLQTKNDLVDAAVAPTIEVQGSALSLKPATMDLGTAGRVSQVSLTSGALNTAVGFTISINLEQPIAAGDSLLLSLPGFSGTSTDSDKQIYGVASSMDIFTTQASAEAYGDEVAAGNAVAGAKFRAGAQGRTPAASSLANGPLGGTLPLDTDDVKVFGHDNRYAERSLLIGDADDFYNVYRSDGASTGVPGFLHFFPAYKQRGAAAAVPAGTAYQILPELELTAKKAACAGTSIDIVVPASAGITTPAGVISGVTLAHVRGGAMAAAIVGSSVANADNSKDNSVLADAVASQVVLATSTSVLGLVLYPSRMPPKSSLNIDGYRNVVDWDGNSNTATLLAGYGTNKATTLHATEATSKLVGSTLAHTASLVDASDDIWLGLSDISAIKPTLAAGHYLQVGKEVMMYTGDSAQKATAVVSNPETVGATCKVAGGGSNCAGVGCATVTFTGCSDNPTVSVTFTDGAISGITVLTGGACSSEPTATLALATGVACGTNPAKGNGLVATLAGTANVIKVKRKQLGTEAITATCSGASACNNVVNPASLFLVNDGSASLLYTNSPGELDYAAGQSLRLNSAITLNTLAGGDQVTAVANPETVGVACAKSGATCADSSCAVLTVSGCSVAPSVTVAFTNGAITGFTVASPGVCRSGAAATLALASGVTCTTSPACGTGCAITLDTTKDVVVAKYADDQTALSVNQGSAVKRVHAAHADTRYRVSVVPPQLLAVTSSAVQTVFAGTPVSNPAVGKEFVFTDPVTRATLATLVADGPVISFSVKWKTNADGTAITYPADGAMVNVTSASGFFIAGRAVDVSIELPTGATYGVRVTLPISFNNNGTLPSIRRAAAPSGYEFRLNAECACPASTDFTTATCSINATSTQQVLLVPVTECAATPAPAAAALAWGLGLGLGLGIPLIGVLFFLAVRKRRPELPQTAPKQEYAQYLPHPVFPQMSPPQQQQEAILYSSQTGSPTVPMLMTSSLQSSPMAQNLYVSGPSSPSLAVAGYTQDGQPLFIQTSSPQQAVQQVQQVVQSSIVPISQYSPPPAQYSPQPAGGEPREPYGV